MNSPSVDTRIRKWMIIKIMGLNNANSRTIKRRISHDYNMILERKFYNAHSFIVIKCPDP